MSHIVLQPAFILHTRAYRDSSLLVSLLTLQHGHITVLAKGCKSRPQMRALLSPFISLLVSWSGKGELPVLGKVEPNDISYNLAGTALLSGIYINELLIKLLPQHDPHANVYALYQQTLQKLQHDSQHLALRIFEKRLLIALGYGLQFDKEANGDKIDAASWYYFKSGVGFLKSVAHIGEFELFSGKTLLALHHEQFDSESIKDAKKLLQSVLQHVLGNKIINSKSFFIPHQMQEK